MKRATQNMLYHLLPAVFWLLAVGGSFVPIALSLSSLSFQLSANYYWGYLVAAIGLVCFVIIGRIKRHTSSIEECFQVALLLGIASYWLPTVIVMIIPIWGYLIYQNLFSLRSFIASLLGFATIAIWAIVLNYLSILDFPFSLAHNLWAWIPASCLWIAWLASTIARQILRVR